LGSYFFNTFSRIVKCFFPVIGIEEQRKPEEMPWGDGIPIAFEQVMIYNPASDVISRSRVAVYDKH
jgi:methylthioribose-1-phosphate isomerase